MYLFFELREQEQYTQTLDSPNNQNKITELKLDIQAGDQCLYATSVFICDKDSSTCP